MGLLAVAAPSWNLKTSLVRLTAVVLRVEDEGSYCFFIASLSMQMRELISGLSGKFQ